jgi:hypothetical protein
MVCLRYPDPATLRFWRNVLSVDEFNAAVARFSKEAGSDQSQQAIMEVEQQGTQTQEETAVRTDVPLCGYAPSPRGMGAPFLVRKAVQASLW